MPSPVRQSSCGFENNRPGGKLSDAEFQNGNRGGQHTDSPLVRGWYWMTDKAGHLCRFTKIDKCNTLQATDYKDPPVIVV